MYIRKWLADVIAVAVTFFVLTFLWVSKGEITLAEVTDTSVPNALPDYYFAGPDQPLSIPFDKGVLANDVIESLLGYATGLVDNVTNGTLELNSSGSFTYTPNPGFRGKDTFTYRLLYIDGDSETPYNTTTVSIVVDKVIADDPELLDVQGESDAPVVPTFLWSHFTTDSPNSAAAAYYNVKLTKGGVTLYDEWLETAAVFLCNGIYCQWTLTDLDTGTGFELYENGYYEWTIQAWTWTNTAKTEGELSEPRTGYFRVKLPTAGLPDFNVIENRQGLLNLNIADDGSTSWLNIYIGEEGGGQLYLYDWFWKGSMECGGGSCYLPLNVYPPNGDYEIYMQGWGPGGYSTGGIAGSGFAGETFTRSLPAPAAVAGVTVTAANTGRPIFHFDPVNHAPWYNIQMSVGDVIVHDNWYPVDPSGFTCILSPVPELSPSVPCRFTPDVLLENNAEVNWKVGVWGPGLTGNIPYIEGSFTVNATSQVPVLVKPTGTVTTVFLGFEWQPFDASWYHVVIERGSSVVFDRWYSHEQVFCYVSENGNCFTFYYNLSEGSHTFKVQGYGPAGLGAFSDDMAFTIDLP